MDWLLVAAIFGAVWLFSTVAAARAVGTGHLRMLRLLALVLVGAVGAVLSFSLWLAGVPVPAIHLPSSTGLSLWLALLGMSVMLVAFVIGSVGKIFGLLSAEHVRRSFAIALVGGLLIVVADVVDQRARAAVPRMPEVSDLPK